MKKFIFLFLFLFLIDSCAKTYKVALFIPGKSPFWTLISDFMQEAANDLDIELQVFDAHSDHLKMITQVKASMYGSNKVDVIVFQNFKQTAPKIIKIAEEAKVYSFMINSPVQEKDNLGKPREKYKYWIGAMNPSDTDAAKQMSQLLIQKSRQKTAIHKKRYMLAFAGRKADTATTLRIKGLKASVKNQDDIVLQQIFYTDWSAEDAFEKLNYALKRYPKTTMIWSANYKTTYGLIKSLKQKNLKPGKDIFINTFGLLENVLQEVKEGSILATTGGHYIESAWALVLIYDFLHGKDFKSEFLEMKTPMPIITEANVRSLLPYVTSKGFSTQNLQKIDFTQYSKVLNPKLKEYDFDFLSILKELKEAP